MAKPTGAEKRHKQSLKRRARNRHVRSTVKTAVKEVRAAIQEENPEKAAELLPSAAAVIARAGSKGVFHKKTVARKIARLSRAAHKAKAKPAGK